MQIRNSSIQPHNEAAAALWGSGGRGYDNVSFAISDALAHTAQRLNARAGESVLDVATGTGWSARNAARDGAAVTAIDISPQLIGIAKALSAHVEPKIDFRVADAEAMPFEDGSFDRIISTFGVMFATEPRAAARELARVCRKGGRLAIAAWVPGGAAAAFFGVIAAHDPRPGPQHSPLQWGDEEGVGALLGGNFDLVFERATSHAYHESVEDIWRWYLDGFGPLKSLHQSLDPAGQAALKADVDAYHAHYLGAAGLTVPRDYLVTVARRR